MFSYFLSFINICRSLILITVHTSIFKIWNYSNSKCYYSCTQNKNLFGSLRPGHLPTIPEFICKSLDISPSQVLNTKLSGSWVYGYEYMWKHLCKFHWNICTTQEQDMLIADSFDADGYKMTILDLSPTRFVYVCISL